MTIIRISNSCCNPSYDWKSLATHRTSIMQCNESRRAQRLPLRYASRLGHGGRRRSEAASHPAMLLPRCALRCALQGDCPPPRLRLPIQHHGNVVLRFLISTSIYSIFFLRRFRRSVSTPYRICRAWGRSSLQRV